MCNSTHASRPPAADSDTSSPPTTEGTVFGALKLGRPDVLITDIRMPDLSGLQLMERLTRTDPDIPVIVITAHSDLDSAVSAEQGGAFEYLPKPFDIDEAIELVSRAARPSKRRRSRRRASSAKRRRCRKSSRRSAGSRARA